MRTSRGWGRLERREDSQHLAGPRVAIELGFLEDRLAVVHDLEASFPRGYELDARRRVFALDLGRQTDGPWLVVSKRAVFDRDGHGQKLTRWKRESCQRGEARDDRVLPGNDLPQ